MIGVAVAAAFLVSAASMVVVLPVLRRIGAIDNPNHRSSHTVVTPRGGGVALLLGIGCGLAVGSISGDHPLGPIDWGLVTVVLVLGAVGLLDDVRGVSAMLRFSLQVACGVLMDVLVFEGSHRSIPALCAFGVVGVVWLAAYVNAFNFMDGINGISGVSAIVAGLWYAWVGARYGDSTVTVWSLLLTAAAIGFLFWNVPKAHVFLGDVGSYAIGAIIALLAWTVAIRYRQPVTALAPLAIYLVDTAYTLVRRYRAGSSLTEAHREHIYQRLVAHGVSHVVGTGVVLAFTASVCAAVRWLPTVPAVVVATLVLCTYLSSPTVVGRIKAPAA